MWHTLRSRYLWVGAVLDLQCSFTQLHCYFSFFFVRAILKLARNRVWQEREHCSTLPAPAVDSCVHMWHHTPQNMYGALQTRSCLLLRTFPCMTLFKHCRLGCRPLVKIRLFSHRMCPGARSPRHRQRRLQHHCTDGATTRIPLARVEEVRRRYNDTELLP